MKYVSRFPADVRHLWNQLKSMPVPSGMILPSVPRQNLLPAQLAKPAKEAGKRTRSLQVRHIPSLPSTETPAPPETSAVYLPPPEWPTEEPTSEGIVHDPQRLEKTRKLVLELLQSNNGMVLRENVDRLMMQFQIHMPFRELCPELWYSASAVYWRSEEMRHVQLNTQECHLPPEIVSTVLAEVRRERMVPLKDLVNSLNWTPGSANFEKHGPLWVQLERLYELFYAPQVVFATSTVVQFLDQTAMMRHCRELYIEVQRAAGPQVIDCFSEFCHLVLRNLQQSKDGRIHADRVNVFLKSLQFKPKQVLTALKKEVFWSHAESEFDVLLRTSAGQQCHPDPLPDCYLPEYLHQMLLKEVKQNTGCKLSNLIGAMGWNRVSEHKKAYGTLRSVVSGLKELFYDPDYLYLKKTIDTVVEWPATAKGRFFNDDQQHLEQPSETMHELAQKCAVEQVEPPVQVRRLVFGVVMSRGGHCPAEYLDSTIDMQFGIKLSALFQDGQYDMRNLLWLSDRVFLRKRATRNYSIADVSETVCSKIVDSLREHGSRTLEELKQVIKDEMEVSDAIIRKIVSKIPEAFFEPEEVYMLFCLAELIETENVSDCGGVFFRKDEEPAAKRMKIMEKPSSLAWGEEAPPWVMPGVAVHKEGDVGVIISVNGFECTVRVGDVDVEVAVNTLRPVDGEVGKEVKIIDGPQRGLTGKLTGIAGADAIVQIATSFETISLRKVVACQGEW